MASLSRGIAYLLAGAGSLLGAGVAQAELLVLDCKGQKNAIYQISYDTETRAFLRKDDKITQTYRVVRAQAEKNGDVLVWGVTRENGGDLLAFFGSKTMVKNFYGNGSETTDSCTQKKR